MVTMTGVKHDQGKLRYDLVPAKVEEALARVLTYGAEKYGDNNWRHVPDATERYYAALRRHVAAWRMGEELDSESGLPHLSHALACVAFLLVLAPEERDDLGFSWEEHTTCLEDGHPCPSQDCPVRDTERPHCELCRHNDNDSDPSLECLQCPSA